MKCIDGITLPRYSTFSIGAWSEAVVTRKRRNVIVLTGSVAIFLFLLLVPLVPFSTSYPPMAVVRDDCHSGSCFAITFATGTASIIYLLSGSNLGLVSYFNYNQAILVACNPSLRVGPTSVQPCLVDWLWTNWAFHVSVRYSGLWRISYYAYPSGRFTSSDIGTGSYAKGSYNGEGPNSRKVTLSAGNNENPIVCAIAQKLDSSNSNLTLTVDALPYYGSNSTTLPDGSTYVCSQIGTPS